MALSGKVALVTGASRGIGKGIALQLSEAGCTVYITGRNAESLEDAAAEIKERRGKAIPVICDHARDDDVQRVFELIHSEKGRLDILVNNAYSAVGQLTENFGKPFWDIPTTVWDNVNLVGLRNNYICSVHAAKIMTKQQSGFIVNISSGGGTTYIFTPAYGVGKAAVDRMAADCGLELKAHNVTYISLAPGPVRTDEMNAFRKSKPGNCGEVSQLGANAFVGNSSDAVGESIEFSGKCIIALYQDTKLIEKAGQRITTAAVGATYSLVDIDGRSIEPAYHSTSTK